ncbi:MAG: hypothetical protein IT460_08255 [Planctomycetes bacterium]|nr:hypothetical protein [Planctomycetota bacterium]
MLLLAAATPASKRSRLWSGGFFQRQDLTGLTVLDPFMGGGTSLVEAAKCGANVLGVDIDPVACFVTKKELQQVEIARIRRAFSEVQAAVESKLLARYATTLPDGRKGSAVYAFWVETIRCPKCRHTADAHPHYQICREPRAGRQTVLCRSCGALDSIPLAWQSFTCGACSSRTQVTTGCMVNGRFHCPHCDEVSRLTRAEGTGLPAHRLFALDVLPHGSQERVFKAADAADRRLYAQAVRDWHAAAPGSAMLPPEEIPGGPRYDNRPRIYGYRRYTELFNARQLLCLTEIAAEIAKIEDTVAREFLALAFSDCLASNNMLCAFAFDYRKLTPLFSLHSYRKVVRPVENNVWGAGPGRGTFSRAVEKVITGKHYGRRPYELRYLRGRTLPETVYTGDRIRTALQPPAGTASASDSQPWGRVIRGSAADLAAVPSASVDLVLTDPPYYDNLPYSELSDFFHVWLRRVAKGGYFGYQRTHTPWKESLFVGRKGLDRSVEHVTYADTLGRAFAECRRVLRATGLLVFTFHQKKAEAWRAVSAALAQGNLLVRQVFPVRSEGQGAFHSYAGTIKWDAVLVCRPRRRTRKSTPTTATVRQHADAAVATWAARLGRRMRAPDRENLWMALVTKELSGIAPSPRLDALRASLLGEAPGTAP